MPIGVGNLVKLFVVLGIVMNKNFLVGVSQHLALITSLPFVHTTRTSCLYNLEDENKA